MPLFFSSAARSLDHAWQVVAPCHMCGAKSSMMKVCSVQRAAADLASPLLKSSLYCRIVAATSDLSEAVAGSAGIDANIAAAAASEIVWYMCSHPLRLAFERGSLQDTPGLCT